MKFSKKIDDVIERKWIHFQKDKQLKTVNKMMNFVRYK
mgnify:CR=1 FL=1